MLEQKLKQGDQVRLTVEIGPALQAGSVGYVLGEYPAMPMFASGDGELNTAAPEYRVAFPILRSTLPPEEGHWAPKGARLEELKDKNIVPVGAAEVEIMGNMLEGK